jgi:hypothetical protein
MNKKKSYFLGLWCCFFWEGIHLIIYVTHAGQMIDPFQKNNEPSLEKFVRKNRLHTKHEDE